VDENVIIWAGLDDFALPAAKEALHFLFVSLQHGQERLGVHVVSSVVFGYAWVDVGSPGPVDDVALDRVIFVVGDVVVHHDHDLLVRDAVGVGDLVGVAHVRLVPVVPVPVRAGDEQDPVLPGGGRARDQAQRNQEGGAIGEEGGSHDGQIGLVKLVPAMSRTQFFLAAATPGATSATTRRADTQAGTDTPIMLCGVWLGVLTSELAFFVHNGK
ncbi:hypothetical protein EGW08_003378, partial [Elysia chlorotica]